MFAFFAGRPVFRFGEFGRRPLLRHFEDSRTDLLHRRSDGCFVGCLAIILDTKDASGRRRGL